MKTVKKVMPYVLAGLLALGATAPVMADDVSVGVSLGDVDASVSISVLTTLLSLLTDPLSRL